MAIDDFFEIDFLAVETAKSGDAIALRYKIDGEQFIHVVDGGFSETGKSMVAHIDEYYGLDATIDNVVLTHSDGDHARGLKYVLENRNVRTLWMNRPWIYAEELIDRFSTYNSVDALKSRLKNCYPAVAELEEIANTMKVPIKAAFQGTTIGAFTVMSPPKAAYLDLVVESEKTPEGIEEANKSLGQTIQEALKSAASTVTSLLASMWGEESFPPQETSAENEMSIVQFGELCGKKILLTGDTGRRGLQHVIDFAPFIGLNLPGIDRFQVPHHGSRRNVNSELLDQILGDKYKSESENLHNKFSAFISSALEDKHHPRKSVERAIIHRGGFLAATEGASVRTSHNAPKREGWTALTSRPYPTEQEQ